MNNKPVVWMSPDGKFSKTEGKLFYIPLYTTPQIKELSDVEISLIAEEFTGADGLDVVDFGRAILKKASEK